MKRGEMKFDDSHLTLIVGFEDVPSDDELSEILQQARAYGEVKTATLTVKAPQHRNVRDL